MSKEEFETLTGKAVTVKTFRAFEAAYMESDLTKEDFCKSVKKAVPEKPRYMIGVDRCADKKAVYALHVYKAGKEIGVYSIDEFESEFGASYLEFQKFTF